jgi:DNA (cytosine-5)-methyltransferase 1
MDKVACRTVELNRRWKVLDGDIHDVTSKAILSAADAKKGAVDILIGGPPCQPFSKAGYWAHGDAARMGDPRATTLTEFFRVLRDTKPRAFLLENVPGLAFKGKDEGLRHVMELVREVNREAKTNYQPEWTVLNAAAYGVPQQRERLFIVASREGRPFKFPPLTHTDPQEPAEGLEPYRTAWDALGDLPQRTKDEDLTVSGRWANMLPSIPEGQNYLHHTSRGKGEDIFGWRTRYWSFLLKLKKTLPAWTIQAQPGPAIGPFHWTSRKLSAAELCRLQTFPDGIRFDCSRNEVQRLIGNAVPSLVTEVIGRAIREQFFDERLRRRELKLLPPVRTPVPKPEPEQPLAAEYEELIGKHADHPGNGRGPGARRRAGLVDESQTQLALIADAE